MEGAAALVVDAGKFAVAKSLGGWEFSIGLTPATGPSVDFGPIVDCSEPGDAILAESEPRNSDYLASGLVRRATAIIAMVDPPCASGRRSSDFGPDAVPCFEPRAIRTRTASRFRRGKDSR
jgi:hypothetical protein